MARAKHGIDAQVLNSESAVTEGKFQGTITIETDSKPAANTAKVELNIIKPERIVFWVDASVMDDWPRAAAAGIVQRRKKDGLPSGRGYQADSYDLNLSLVFGSNSGELLTIIRALEIALGQCTERSTTPGNEITEVVIFSDSKAGLQSLVLYRQGHGRYDPILAELVELSGMFADADINLHIHWIPKKAKVPPHTMADRVAKRCTRDFRLHVKVALYPKPRRGQVEERQSSTLAGTKRPRSSSPEGMPPTKRTADLVSEGSTCSACDGIGHETMQCPQYASEDRCRYCSFVGHGKSVCPDYAALPKKSFIFSYVLPQRTHVPPTPDSKKRTFHMRKVQKEKDVYDFLKGFEDDVLPIVAVCPIKLSVKPDWGHWMAEFVSLERMITAREVLKERSRNNWHNNGVIIDWGEDYDWR